MYVRTCRIYLLLLFLTCLSHVLLQESSGEHPKGPKMGKEPGK